MTELNTPNVRTTLEQGELVEGKYRIQSLLAEGGMGAVYHAVQEPLGRDVALKILKSAEETEDQRDTRLKRFFREAALCSRLNHPNTVMIFDYGKLTSISGFFLVMEFLRGRSLRDVMNEEVQLSPELTLHIGMQIASSLADAHKAGVVHRDLKPPNIMLVERGDDPHFVKVVDFGLVKDMNQGDDELTAENTLIGSPMYMAPERFLYHNADSPAVDVYALGIMMYEMLVGRPPFTRDTDSTVHRIMMQHIQTEPPPMRTFQPNLQLPEGLEALVMRCLAKQPQDRFESMESLIRLMRACLQNNPVSPSSFQQARQNLSDSGEYMGPIVSLESTPTHGHFTEETKHTIPASIREAALDSALATPQRTEHRADGTIVHADAPVAPIEKKTSKAPILAIGLAVLVFLGLVGYSMTKGPDMVTVEVLSEPLGANVYVDGKLVGATPAKVELADQSNARVTLEAEGFKRREELVTASKGMQFSLKLEPVEVKADVQPQPEPEKKPTEVPVKEEVEVVAEPKVEKTVTTKVKKTVKTTKPAETKPADKDVKLTR